MEKISQKQKNKEINTEKFYRFNGTHQSSHCTEIDIPIYLINGKFMNKINARPKDILI